MLRWDEKLAVCRQECEIGCLCAVCRGCGFGGVAAEYVGGCFGRRRGAEGAHRGRTNPIFINPSWSVSAPKRRTFGAERLTFGAEGGKRQNEPNFLCSPVHVVGRPGASRGKMNPIFTRSSQLVEGRSAGRTGKASDRTQSTLFLCNLGAWVDVFCGVLARKASERQSSSRLDDAWAPDSGGRREWTNGSGRLRSAGGCPLT